MWKRAYKMWVYLNISLYNVIFEELCIVFNKINTSSWLYRGHVTKILMSIFGWHSGHLKIRTKRYYEKYWNKKKVVAIILFWPKKPKSQKTEIPYIITLMQKCSFSCITSTILKVGDNKVSFFIRGHMRYWKLETIKYLCLLEVIWGIY